MAKRENNLAINSQTLFLIRPYFTIAIGRFHGTAKVVF
jgi:hypothetical protein